eukprot:gene26107-biopygen14091
MWFGEAEAEGSDSGGVGWGMSNGAPKPYLDALLVMLREVEVSKFGWRESPSFTPHLPPPSASTSHNIYAARVSPANPK